MKKIIIVPSFLLLLLIPTILTYAEPDYYQPAEESKEELMMDLFFSLLLPNVQEAVSNYYSDYLTTSPLVKLLSVYEHSVPFSHSKILYTNGHT
ncbi:hypothetical protein ACTHOQ_13365 [Solibacillus silvestris]|uniref:hypothetical protein n=1 Tax=Solibacillus silvestris TaxID=76853 RepID=UPI003F7EDAAC